MTSVGMAPGPWARVSDPRIGRDHVLQRAAGGGYRTNATRLATSRIVGLCHRSCRRLPIDQGCRIAGGKTVVDVDHRDAGGAAVEHRQ